MIKKTIIIIISVVVTLFLVSFTIGLTSIIVNKNEINADMEKQNITTIQNDMLSFEAALKLYKKDNGFYPTTEQGLKALVKKTDENPIPKNFRPNGYLKRIPRDPWGFRYVYKANTENPKHEYIITSYGVDGKPGGEGVNRDFSFYK